MSRSSSPQPQRSATEGPPAAAGGPSPAVWPLDHLRLRSGPLELRLPDDRLLREVALLAGFGVHPEDQMPFSVPWTRGSPIDRARSVLQFHWSQLAELRPERWTLPFVVIHDGEVRGFQDLAGFDFGVLRTVSTGSWLGARHQRRGIGTAMRAAVLGLAFEHMGAVRALTGAFEDNPGSLGVSRALGYREDGDELRAVLGLPRRTVRFVMTRAEWEAQPRPALEVTGLEECRPLLGC